MAEIFVMRQVTNHCSKNGKGERSGMSDKIFVD
jgi:hypothetical protein